MRPMYLIVIIDIIYILKTVKQFLGYLKMSVDEFTSRHVLFRGPANLHMSEMDRRTERFHHHVLRELRLDKHNCTSFEYYTHIGIIQSLVNHRVYCAGHVAYKFLTGILLRADVLDIQQISDHKIPKELNRAPCGIRIVFGLSFINSKPLVHFTSNAILLQYNGYFVYKFSLQSFFRNDIGEITMSSTKFKKALSYNNSESW